MNKERRSVFLRGMRGGWPIGVGYFAVALALGIVCRNVGLTAFEAGLMSALCTASAGEFGGIAVMQSAGTLIEIAVMELIVNARYFLMSCALTQKLDPKLSLPHRLVLANFITDEIFGLSIGYPGTLDPFYTYGVVAASWPGWIAGTVLGVVLGNILPANIVSALSVGLYGMFLAIIIPPVRKDPVIRVLVPFSMAAAWAFYYLNQLGILRLSGGTRIIVLTIVISLAAAILFPHVEEDDADCGHEPAGSAEPEGKEVER